MIKDIIVDHERARFDRAHFKGYGDSALLFEVVYYVLSSDYADYMDIQQDINLTIYELFEKNRIDFAYPTQTLHLAGDDKRPLNVGQRQISQEKTGKANKEKT